MPTHRLPFGIEQSAKQNSTIKEQLKLAEQLVKMSDDTTREWAIELRDRIRMPMSTVLDKVPGISVADRCRKIGIARQTYYSWLHGELRPSSIQAQKLSELTGIPADKIRRHRKRLSAPPPSGPAATPRKPRLVKRDGDGLTP